MTSFDSSLTKAIDGLEDLLIGSATFLASFVEDELSEAQIRDQRIHLEAIMDDEDKFLCKLPAVAILETEHMWELFSHGPGLQLGAGGSINLLLARPANFRSSHKQSRRDFVGWASKIIDEIAVLTADGDTWYQFANMSVIQTAVRPPKAMRADATNDYWWCQYQFDFGFDE